MKYVEIVADAGSAATVMAIAEKYKAPDVRLGVVGEDGMQPMRMLVADDRLQSVLDTLQHVLGAQPTARIVVLEIEVSLPKPETPAEDTQETGTATREALYESVERSSRLDGNYLVLVVLSTVVAAIGLIESNVAVVIGAMVIAPLLGPNLALSLGTALGDLALVRKSAKALLAGVVVTVVLSAALSAVWPFDTGGSELALRTHAGLDSIGLALASGAAAALSLTTGLSSVLVGVMVAVALLPPAATFGLMLGHQQYALAAGAALLLTVNIVSVNLAAKIVFFVKDIRPRTWHEKEKANRAMIVYVLGWLVSLVILVVVMYLRKTLAA
ncbi:MAG: TIGR00341 family protein [Betaproteobacteria bacterium]|nr:TIGR00341 family protein [Betaproteobacteria bacterium]